MNPCYDIDSTKVTHREYWWGSKSPLVLIGWIIKWLRIRLPGSSDDPNIESLQPCVVAELPLEVQSRFQPLTTQLAALEFHSPVYHVIEDPGTGTKIFWATLLHASGNYFARIHNRTWSKAPKASRALSPMFFTEFADGTFLVSSAAKPDMLAPAAVQMNRMHNAPVEKLWAAHQQLVESASARKNISPVSSPEEVLAAVERHHIVVRDFHLARGVFKPRSAAAQAQATAFAARVEEVRAQGLEHAEVLAELENLQNKKPGWGSAIWILAISFVAFIAAGAAKWNWKFTLLLLPILFFHEAGHWVAMRFCRYRNLRMFFIPLFGAAVSGQNWNVPGWKKALVSLAGPVPGIALGVVLGTVGLLMKKPLLTEAATLALFLNGFNLLPILPLDGGHVLQATLFCRNRWLDFVFRLLAIVGLLVMGIVGQMKFMPYIAIAMGLGLPVLFKLGKVTDELRKQNLPQPLPDEDHIPTATAQAIITAVKAALPKVTGAKMIATHSLSVFETLNARPPHWLATLALLGLHGGAIVLTIVFGMLLVIGKHGGIADFIGAAVRQPQHALACEAVTVWRGEASAVLSWTAHDTLVATFPKRVSAQAAFAELTNQSPATSSLMLFGDSVVLTLPVGTDATREKWFDDLQTYSTNSFVVPSNSTVNVSLTFLAPTETVATNLQRELGDYFQLTGMFHLVAPWSPAAKGADYEARRLARRQWQRITRETGGVWRDPTLRAYSAKILAATRRGATAEARRLSEEQNQQVERIREQIFARLRADTTNRMDPALLDLHAQLDHLNYTNRAERTALLREIAPLLGGVPPADGSPAPNADPFGTTAGYASKHGLLIEMSWTSFRDPGTGLPALIEWLCGQNCRKLQYDFEGSAVFSDLEETAEE